MLDRTALVHGDQAAIETLLELENQDGVSVAITACRQLQALASKKRSVLALAILRVYLQQNRRSRSLAGLMGT